jgi:uncharacterized membrane protein
LIEVDWNTGRVPATKLARYELLATSIALSATKTVAQGLEGATLVGPIPIAILGKKKNGTVISIDNFIFV